MSSNERNKSATADKPWSGRFGEPVTDLVKRFTASVTFDQRLAEFDVEGSLAHARMLHAAGIVSKADLAAIEKGMAQVLKEVRGGTFAWSLDLEDVHLNIERRLTELAGDAGKRLHTARSRNDQVATDVRLYLRDRIDAMCELITGLQVHLLDLAEAEAATVMPGFTHLQVAQPVTFGHHMMAWFEMLQRDHERLLDCRGRVNRLPLGAAALAGTDFPIDRALTAELLGFDELCANSLDAVSDRDFAVEFTAAASLIMVHLSRWSEELVLWMSTPFAFVDLPDRFCTGSSIMPQKKNPDVPELIRGKSGRVIGHLVALLTLLKGQPLAYNRDNQEDKEPLFDTIDTTTDCLRAYVEMLPHLTVNRETLLVAASRGFATATDLADYLVKRGLPFRDAHDVVGRLVAHAISERCGLADIPLAKLREFDARIDEEVFAILTLEGSVNARAHPGGTAPDQVRSAVAAARASLATR